MELFQNVWWVELFIIPHLSSCSYLSQVTLQSFPRRTVDFWLLDSGSVTWLTLANRMVVNGILYSCAIATRASALESQKPHSGQRMNTGVTDPWWTCGKEPNLAQPQHEVESLSWDHIAPVSSAEAQARVSDCCSKCWILEYLLYSLEATADCCRWLPQRKSIKDSLSFKFIKKSS